MRPTLLMTRPAAQSARFAAAFRARFGQDWPVVISPLTELVLLDGPADVADARAVVFTSETGAAAFTRLSPRRDLPAWAVGARTAQAARSAGFDVLTGPGDGAGLARAIVAAGGPAPVVVVRGVHQAFDIAESLEKAGIAARSLTLYDQPEMPLSGPARLLAGGRDPVLVPLFSPRAAELAARAIPAPHAPLLVAAISPAVAQAAAALGPARLETAEAPGSGPVLDALARLIGHAAAA